MAKKAALIIAQNNFRDEELLDTKKVLEDKGIECTIFSKDKATAKGMLGTEIMPDKTYPELEEQDYDSIIIIGGSGSPSIMEEEHILEVLRQAFSHNKVIGAICLGGMTLAKSGILKGYKATVFKTDASLKIYEENGVSYTDNNIVVDRNIVTANGPHAAKGFGLKLSELILNSA